MSKLPSVTKGTEAISSGLQESAAAASNVEPSFRKTSFQCPRCSVVSMHWWESLHIKRVAQQRLGFEELADIALSRCVACQGRSFWLDQKLVYPTTNVRHSTPPDLPEAARKDFEEAAAVANASPRAAAALLRSCVEGICMSVANKKKFEDAIRKLEAEGIPQGIVKAMDVVRLTGNGALHAGVLYGEDDEATVGLLFKLVETIVSWAVTQKRQLDELYKQMPPGALEQIEKRRAKQSREQPQE